MRLFLDGKLADLTRGFSTPSSGESQYVLLDDVQKAKLDSVQYGATRTLLGTTSDTAAAGNDSRLGTILTHLPGGGTAAVSGVDLGAIGYVVDGKLYLSSKRDRTVDDSAIYWSVGNVYMSGSDYALMLRPGA